MPSSPKVVLAPKASAQDIGRPLSSPFDCTRNTRLAAAPLWLKRSGCQSMRTVPGTGPRRVAPAAEASTSRRSVPVRTVAVTSRPSSSTQGDFCVAGWALSCACSRRLASAARHWPAPARPPLARVSSTSFCVPVAASPCSDSVACAMLPASSARSALNCTWVAAAPAWAAGSCRSSLGTARLALRLGSALPRASGAAGFCSRRWKFCQPPCQLASSRAEPFALRPANRPAISGRLSIQRCTASVSSMRALSSPVPCAGAMRASTCASAPGIASFRLPLPACSATRTCSLPSTLARCASMRSVRRSSTWSFHWPWASTRSSPKPGRALLPAPPSARSARSKPMPSSRCCAVTRPLIGAPESSLYSAPSRTPCTSARACQGAGAGLQRPAASMRPPPARSVACGMSQWVPS